MTVSLVTGAGGFVGGHLCRHLEQCGHHVRRVSSQPDVCSWRGACLLDLDPSRLAEVLEGADQVYFLAGIAHEALAGRDADRLRDVNVVAPLAWLRAAERVGVRRFVWLSSIKVLGDRSEQPLAPDAAYRPGDAYARSKVEAENRLLDEPLQNTTLVVVRPPLVYGPGVRGNFAALLRLADSPWPLPTGAATAPRSLVAVANLCDLLARLARDGAGIFHVADGEDLSVARLVAILRRALGRPVRQHAVPAPWMRLALGSVGRAGMYGRLFEPLQVDVQATRQRLDWAPPQTPGDALGETAAWFETSR